MLKPLQDWETGIYQSIRPIIQHSGKPWTRDEALAAFDSVEMDLQAQNPTDLYSKILADSYYAFAKRLDLPEGDTLKEASIAFGNSVGNWPVFPDTIEALAKLSKHYRLVVLSNVDNTSFSHTRRVLEQGFEFDLVLTAQVTESKVPSKLTKLRPPLAGYRIIQARSSQFRVYAEDCQKQIWH